jgi:hypothetical protein
LENIRFVPEVKMEMNTALQATIVDQFYAYLGNLALTVVVGVVLILVGIVAIRAAS